MGKTVIVTGCNFGFVNHLHNFQCYMERLGMKFLVIAMDERAHEYISRNTTMISYLMFNGTGESQGFRSKQFNVLTSRKIKAVYNILSAGNVVSSFVWLLSDDNLLLEVFGGAMI